MSCKWNYAVGDSCTRFPSLNIIFETSGQDGSIGKHGSPPHTPTSKLQLNIEQPSLRTIRNGVELKCDNYRIKETTSIQTDRRNGFA